MALNSRAPQQHERPTRGGLCVGLRVGCFVLVALEWAARHTVSCLTPCRSGHSPLAPPFAAAVDAPPNTRADARASHPATTAAVVGDRSDARATAEAEVQ